MCPNGENPISFLSRNAAPVPKPPPKAGCTRNLKDYGTGKRVKRIAARPLFLYGVF